MMCRYSSPSHSCHKPKSESGCWRNPREIQPATPHEPDQPQKLKQDAQTLILLASRQTEVLQSQPGQWEHNLTDTWNSAGMPPHSIGKKTLKYSSFFFPYHWGKKNPAENTEQNLSRFPTMAEPCITYPLLTASSSFQGCFLQEKREGICLKKLN